MADRRRREGLRHGPVRLADGLGRRRRADGAGDVPLRAPGHRLDRARPGRRAAARPSTACSWCCPGWPCSTSSWRSSSCSACTGRRSRPVQRRLARPPRRPDELGRSARWRAWWRPWLLAGRRRFGLAVRHQVDGASTRSRPSACWPGCGAPAPAARSASAGRCCKSVVARRRPGLRRSWSWSRLVVYVATWTGWLMHADEYEERVPQHAVHARTAAARRGRPRPSRTPTGSARSPSRCGRSGTTTRTSTPSTRHFLNDSTHIYASKPSGWLLLNRPVGVDAQTDIQPGTQGCDAPTGSTACGRCC